MPHDDAEIEDLANELATWPGVHVERRADGAAVIRYDDVELGVLYLDRKVAELPFIGVERDELIEHGEAEPGDPDEDAPGVSHDVRGPSDLTEVLELFDRRYREARGESDVYTSEDPGYEGNP